MADEDRALFEAALSDEPVTEAVHEEPAEQPAQEGQPRDEHGRFAPKVQAESEAEPAQVQQEQPPQQEDRSGHIPAWRLKEEADARREAERRAQEYEQRVREFEQRIQAIQAQQQPQTPPEVPDIFENPQAYTSHLQSQFQNEMRNMRLEFSFEAAHERHGEQFEKAYAALVQAGQMGNAMQVQQIANSPNPGKALMRWYQERQLYETTGGNLEEWMTKKQEELLNDPAFLAKAVERVRAQNGNGSNGQRPITQLPPSLSRVPSAAPASPEAGDMSDAALFAQALR